MHFTGATSPQRMISGFGAFADKKQMPLAAALTSKIEPNRVRAASI